MSSPIRNWYHDLRVYDVPGRWASEERVGFSERAEMALLRLAGCKCEFPLLGGYMEEYDQTYVQAGVRCRVCNVSVYFDVAPQGPESDSGPVSEERVTETPVVGGKALYGAL